MKKVAYIAGGILIGFVLSTSAGAFADSVKSLVGKKVSGEYTVIVDGHKLADKGAIIDGKANVPVRGISEALGADIKVSGKTITVTTTDTTNDITAVGNPYEGRSEADLLSSKTILEDRILKPTKAGKESLEVDLAKAKENGDEYRIGVLEKEIALHSADIEKYSNELAQIEAALAALK